MPNPSQPTTPPTEGTSVDESGVGHGPHPPKRANGLMLTWDISSIFANSESWRDEFRSVKKECSAIEHYQLSPLSDPQVLHSCLHTVVRIQERLARLESFAELRSYENTLDQTALMMADECKALRSRVESLSSFIEPTILGLGWDVVDRMLQSYPPLQTYRFYLENLEKTRRHVLSAEVEAALAIVNTRAYTPYEVYRAAVEQDLSFDPIDVAAGSLSVDHGTIDTLLSSTDSKTRQQAYESYGDGYLSIKYTLAATLTSLVQSSLAEAHVRHFTSTFEQVFFDQDIPSGVYDTSVGSCLASQGVFQRYFELRAARFGCITMGEHDIFAPLSDNPPKISYDDGIEMIFESLAPLGERYLETLWRGLLVERWADVEPRPHKQSGAFSAGTYGTHPFLMLSYHGSVIDISTLAHEAGHSVHSYMTNSTQPSCYSDYAMIVAETASNLNQVLLREHIFSKGDRELSLAALDDAFYFMHRYLFLMPILSSLERKTHDEYASGGSVSLDDLCEWTREAFTTAYGPAVTCDEERVGIKWAQYAHLYDPGYPFQYIVGLSAALVIGKRFRAGEEGLKERYEEFLSAGSSMPPADIFKIVGIDISSPELYRSAFREVERYNQILEDALRKS